MTRKVKMNQMSALEKAQYLAAGTVGARKMTLFRPGQKGAVDNFLKGWVPTICGYNVRLPGWPEVFHTREQAKNHGRIFRESCRDYLQDTTKQNPVEKM